MNTHALPIKHIVTAALLSLLAQYGAAAQFMPPPDFPPHAGPEAMPTEASDRLPPFLRGLKLSDAQEDRIFDIFQEQARPVHERVRAIRNIERALIAMSLSEDYDEAKAGDLIEIQARAHAQLRLIKLKTERQIYALLTPEQFRQLSSRNAPKAQLSSADAHSPEFGARRPEFMERRPPAFDRRP